MNALPRKLLAAMGLAGALALGGCAYDDGYGGVSVGTGYYGGYGNGYGDPYWGSGYYPGGYYGWYDGFYYPGNGYYVYDRGGRRHRWTDGQRRHWEGRRGRHDGDGRWGNRRPDWRGDDGRQNGGNWTRPRPDGDGRGRNDWRGNRRGGDGARNMAPAQPQARPSQPRAQRDWGNRPSPRMNSERSMPSGRGRGPSSRVRPD
ncbi:hypothetical protein J3E64_001240 [Sphingobium sp. OAS761]|uniref:peptidase n=1 Tax=Sphingobium sp. OAS761 TaxID=2817901 RepID=UPI00209EAA18|nr:peptidase [Sphingobium sp. OAS761]MCP1469565.1 hypothetical protein [Sphingobium sp. OAS761]